MRSPIALATLFTLGLTLALVAPPATAGEADRNAATVTTLRLRMGVVNQVFLYPPTVPMIEGERAVLFFSGDWGWKPIHQEVASWLANHGRYVVGIDAPAYFSRNIDPSDWVRDLKTLREFVNQKAGLPAKTPIVLIGFTWGAEMVPYMLNRGGAEGFEGALLIGPNEQSGSVYRVTLQMRSRNVPLPPDEQFSVVDEVRRMAPIPVVFMQGELDTESRAATLAPLARGPHMLVSIPVADKQFHDVRDVFYTMVGQALTWIEGPHTPGESAPPQAAVPPPATPRP